MANLKQAIKWMQEGKKVTIERAMWYAKIVGSGYIMIYDSDGKNEREMLASILGTDRGWEIFETKEDIINEFNNFIRKWCGNSVPHLLDSDGNDGERFRNKLRKCALEVIPDE